MILALVLGFCILAPEWQAYRSEQKLLQANLLLQAALTGQLPDADPLDGVRRMLTLAQEARIDLPHDPRAILIEGMGYLMLSRLDEAEQTFVAALRQGERPELLVNYGRVLAARGDHDGAHAAMLRAAFIAPGSINTLPKAMRAQIEAEVVAYEQSFVAGATSEIPPMPEAYRRQADHKQHADPGR